MADERKDEKRNRAESEDGGDGEGGVFFVGIDGALRGDDGGDTADGRADSEERGEFWFQSEGFAERGHEGERESDFDGDEDEADSAEFENVSEKETRAEQHDSGFEPEFVSGEAGLERGGNASGVGDEEAEKDGPEYVLDIRQREVVRFSVLRDRALDKFPGVADCDEQQKAGDYLTSALEQAERLRIAGGRLWWPLRFVLLK